MTDDLISAAELAAALESGGEGPSRLRVLDVRWSLGSGADRDAYGAGHVPTAVFCDLDDVLAGPPGAAGRHPLPDPRHVQAWLASHLISAEDEVVVYDGRDSVAAARAWWVLRWVGQSGVRVLDGGWDAWLAGGWAVETAPNPTPVGAVLDVEGDETSMSWPTESSMPDVDVSEVLAVARDGVLLDARAAERYRGEVEPVDPVAGHIPGALSAPSADNLDADGRFLPPEALRQRFLGLGVDGSRPIAVYCGSGVTAAHEILALRRAGLDASLFAGSWSAWISDPSRPVATGPEPGDVPG
ncbi:MAG: sulfurtransferase [Actinomycetes bacterium]